MIVNIGATEIQQKAAEIGPGRRSRSAAIDVWADSSVHGDLPMKSGPIGQLAACRPGFVVTYPIRLVARSQKSV
jgi:hypothetical protein